jgi:hypothetical protein
LLLHPSPLADHRNSTPIQSGSSIKSASRQKFTTDHISLHSISTKFVALPTNMIKN